MNETHKHTHTPTTTATTNSEQRVNILQEVRSKWSSHTHYYYIINILQNGKSPYSFFSSAGLHSKTFHTRTTNKNKAKCTTKHPNHPHSTSLGRNNNNNKWEKPSKFDYIHSSD